MERNKKIILGIILILGILFFLDYFGIVDLSNVLSIVQQSPSSSSTGNFGGGMK